MSKLLILDGNLLRYITRYLGKSNCLALSLSCKRIFNMLLNCEIFWQELVRKEFPQFENRRPETTWKAYYKLLAGYTLPEIFDGFTTFQMVMIFELLQYVTFYSEKQEQFKLSHEVYLDLVKEFKMTKYLDKTGQLNWKKAEEEGEVDIMTANSFSHLYILADDLEMERPKIYDRLRKFIEFYFFYDFQVEIDLDLLNLYLMVLFPFGQHAAIKLMSPEDNNLIKILYKGFVVTDRTRNPTRERYLENQKREEAIRFQKLIEYYNKNELTLICYMEKAVFPELNFQNYSEEEHVKRVLLNKLIRKFYKNNYPKEYIEHIIKEHIDKIKINLTTLFNDNNRDEKVDNEIKGTSLNLTAYREMLIRIKELNEEPLEKQFKMTKAFRREKGISKQEVYLIIQHYTTNKI